MNYYWFAAIFAAIGYLFAKYGKMQYDQGRKSGYSAGKIEGILYGMQNAFQFLEELGVVNLAQIETDLNDGKYDHIKDIAKNRKIGGRLANLITKPTK
jgi:hypothetical protein